MIKNRPQKMIELAIRRAEFDEAESASHGMTATWIRYQPRLDEMADEIRDLEELLEIPENERQF